MGKEPVEREHVNNALIRALKDAFCIPYDFKERGIISSEVIRALDDFLDSWGVKTTSQVATVVLRVKTILEKDGIDSAKNMRTDGVIDDAVMLGFRKFFEKYDDDICQAS